MNKAVLTTGAEIRAAAEKIVKKAEEAGGLRRVYCVACGGSKASMYPIDYLLSQESSALSVQSVSANEFYHATPKGVGPDALVIGLSLGGGTAETVNACKKARELGAATLSLTIRLGTPLSDACEYNFIFDDETQDYQEEARTHFEATNQLILLRLGFELLRLCDGYAHYDAAVEGCEKLPEICRKAAAKAARRAVAYGEARKDDPVMYTIGSGPSMFTAYMQCICMFMEMEWIHSSSIHAGEFFHGPFEITDRDVPFTIFMNEGRTRALDERALSFLRQYADMDKVTVIDVKEYGINAIDDSVEEYFSAVIAWAVAFEYALGLAAAKKHPIFQRRYMGKVKY
ncbi:MAG: SIS domain-containing protein [Oscillospiraceae bacterium]|nr:SIS domain-containing protein [Oscillospiraceae bacterium]MDY4192114.1 SIS domain-containing protein [Oscillospiraceae bacterium]